MSPREIRPKDLKITCRGVEYRWTTTAGFTAPGGMAVPMALRPLLEAQLEPLLNAEDAAVKDNKVLVERARQARRLRQLSRAERLARRVLEADPDNAEAAAVLAATLREHQEPEAALRVLLRLARCESVAVQCERAASYADLGRWTEAKKIAVVARELIGRLGGESAEQTKLLERIEGGRAKAS